MDIKDGSSGSVCILSSAEIISNSAIPRKAWIASTVPAPHRGTWEFSSRNSTSLVLLGPKNVLFIILGWELPEHVTFHESMVKQIAEPR